jgi:hypothetical protein
MAISLMSLKNISPLEIVIFIVFVLYLSLNIPTPQELSPYIDSPLGIIFMLVVTLLLFLYTNPILGVLYIFVAYEVLRRTSNTSSRVSLVQHTPSQFNKDADLKAMNPPLEKSLEEDVIEKMAPIGRSDPSVYVETSFKPVSESVHNALIV